MKTKLFCILVVALFVGAPFLYVYFIGGIQL
jgi:hypothetical protein